jgi:hypothetical protein
MHRKLRHLLYFSIILLSTQCFAQSITWQRTYDPSPGRDLGSDICNAGNGNFFITGYKNYFPEQIIIIKINQFGDTLWSKIIPSNYQERGLAIASCNDGGCVVTGESDSSFSLKLGSSGNIIWKKYYGIGGCYDIRPTSDGGFIARGAVVYVQTMKGYVYKIDSVGSLQWQIDYPTSYSNGLYSIDETSDNGFISVGYIKESLSDTTSVLLLKLNDSGNISWIKKYRIGNAFTAALNIKRVNSQFLISGNLALTQQNSSIRVFVSRINISGDTIFNHIINSDRQEGNLGLEIINNNKYVITMTRDSENTNINSKALIVDSMGYIVKEKVFLGVSYLTTNSVILSTQQLK